MPESTSSNPMPHPTLPDHFDVLIVGGGAAGLYTALCLPQQLNIGLITKENLSISASDWAQGGIAAAIAPEDSTTLHIADTLQAGAGLCEPESVALLVEMAASCIGTLVQMGVGFDRQGETLALTLEAAHSRRRVLHAADATGRAMVSTLAAQVLSRSNIQVISQAFVLDLWMQAQDCRGVCLVYQDEIRWLAADHVVLATGGGGQVFAQTTNPVVSTGDGVAMAWRAGAQLRDLEFVQFHPTALTKPGAPHFLISEAVRGEGAHLIDAQGHRFAFDYHPAGELAPRDVVSRSIFRHLQKTAPDNPQATVWLDLKPIPEATIRHRFPNIIRVCQQWGIDLFQVPIPVAPAAHYWMGGVTTNPHSQTSIAHLYAVGETASTGVHGANRLASNSLLECLVFGAQLSHHLSEWLEQTADSRTNSEIPSQDSAPQPMISSMNPLMNLAVNWSMNSPIAPSVHALSTLMWQSAGICREQRSLDPAIAQVKTWRTEFADHPLSQSLQKVLSAPSSAPLPTNPTLSPSIRSWGETRNLLDIAYLILKSAAFRTESRGGHYRSDYPDTDPAWQAHTLVQDEDWKKSHPSQILQ